MDFTERKDQTKYKTAGLGFFCKVRAADMNNVEKGLRKIASSFKYAKAHDRSKGCGLGLPFQGWRCDF